MRLGKSESSHTRGGAVRLGKSESGCVGSSRCGLNLGLGLGLGAVGVGPTYYLIAAVTLTAAAASKLDCAL